MDPDFPLYRRLPAEFDRAADDILERFLDYVAEKKLELYPAQEEAILELLDGKNVILNTPTGSGKSLVAAALHFLGLARGKRSVYTSPIKALVNEKFLALCREFGPTMVGMASGDATVNRDAPILCCTAEILSNMALRDGASAPVDYLILDEFHYYSDRDRGVAWQIPLLTLPQCRFLLMSATLGDTAFFEKELTALTGTETVTVRSSDRPVPLEFAYSEEPLDKAVEELVTNGQAPVYIVHFTQLDCAQSAQSFLSLNFSSRTEKDALAAALEGSSFNSPYGKDIKKYLKHGIGIHHAGLLPKYRVLVEQLAQRGLLKIICGTDTLGVGVNIPIRTVLFTKLCKYDGQKTGLLSARDFHQISGRAGRKGFDDRGWVMALAPEHVIENLKLERKAAGDAKKQKKIVKRKPEKGEISWTKQTFERLMQAPPEPLISRFQVSHSMLLHVLSRSEDGCRAMQRLIRKSHDSPPAKAAHRRLAFQLFRSLVDRKIIDFVRDPERSRADLRINIDLQTDFSLHQTLALYLLDTIRLIDPAHPDYALDVLTLAESIVEDPDIVLRKQLDRIKSRRMAEMKMDGVEYLERMEELEKLEYPKPIREFVYSTFNQFAALHPWVGQENIRPKSIAREMFENFRSFDDYIQDYDLHRAEGVLLRHLSAVYKVLQQTVPQQAKNETIQEIELYFGTMIRQVDSSLLDEWERIQHPEWVVQKPKQQPSAVLPPPDVTRNRAEFIRLIRNRIFTFLRAFASQRFEGALESVVSVPDQEPWSAEKLEQCFKAHRVEHEDIKLDPDARNIRHTFVIEADDKKTWRVEQILVDPEGHNDWSAQFIIDLESARAASAVTLRLAAIGPVGR